MGAKVKMESKATQKRENKEYLNLRNGVIEVKRELAKHEKMPMAKAHPQKK
jgi:hypothetical protein